MEWVVGVLGADVGGNGVGVGVGGVGDGGRRRRTNMNFFPLPFPSVPSNTSGQMETRNSQHFITISKNSSKSS